MTTNAICHSAKQEFLRGIHQPGHVYKLALYTGRARLNEHTVSYAVSSEVEDSGYPSGGITLDGLTTGTDEQGRGFLTFAEASFEAERVTARYGLIYNSSVAGAPSLAVLDFENPVAAVNAPFRVTFPDKLILLE
jgi:hypothetical protein